MHEKVARVPELFLMGVGLLVLLIASGAVEAQHSTYVYPDDEFPWHETGTHWSKSTAEDEARNFANIECNANGLQRDVTLDQMVTNQSNLSCGPEEWMKCWHAQLSFWCEERPPNYAKQGIGEVIGPYNCDPGDAYRKAQAAADRECKMRLRPRNMWFLGNHEVIRIGKIGSGECGSSGFGPNPQYRYGLLSECFVNMNDL